MIIKIKKTIQKVKKSYLKIMKIKIIVIIVIKRLKINLILFGLQTNLINLKIYIMNIIINYQKKLLNYFLWIKMQKILYVECLLK